MSRYSGLCGFDRKPYQDEAGAWKTEPCHGLDDC